MTKQQHEEIKERGIGSEVDHFAYRIPIENHDAMN